jgi:signal transduction histidine kinase
VRSGRRGSPAPLVDARIIAVENRGVAPPHAATKDDLSQRVAFLRLAPDDLARLERLAPILERHADALVAAFYRHLLSFAETRRLLSDAEVKRRLLAKQRQYLLSLAVPSLTRDYIADRLAIGVTHERIGLAPRWYLGAYSLYFSLLAPLVCEEYHHEPERGADALSSLMKVLMLDAQLAMEAYIDRHQRELEYLNRELAAAGSELSLEVRHTRSELRQIEHRAKAAESLASTATLVAALAHEVGTPMGVIQGHAELLESSVVDERGRWRLRTIREQIERITRIIQALLTSARPRETERVPLELEPLLDTSISFLQEKFRRRKIALERRIDRAPPILGDGEKLQQLFLNLLLNAADAMPQGGTVTVSLDVSPAGAARVRISDTGTGIAPEHVGSIFDPFYTTKPAGQGSGLGLVVARSIAMDHDAQLDVESEVGRGTEFRIEFAPAPQAAPGRAT